MPLTDEQFTKFIESTNETKKWLELLIRIDENTKNHSKQLSDHAIDDIGKFALAKQSSDKLHERLDKYKEDVDKSFGFQNKVMGGIAVLVFIVPIMIAWIKH